MVHANDSEGLPKLLAMKRMPVYINAGFGRPVGGSTLGWLGGLGCAGIRQDIPWGIPSVALKPLLAEIAKANGEAVLIVGGWMVWNGGGHIAPDFREGSMPSPSAVAQLARQVAVIARNLGLRCIIDIGNEPNITAAFQNDASRYADTVRRAAIAVWEVDKSIPVAAGSIHDLTTRSREYLKDVLNCGISEKTILAVHPYRMGNRPWAPFSGFDGIGHAVDWLKSIWPGEFAVSECGWHTAPRTEKVGFLGLCRKRVQWTDSDVAGFARFELKFWREAGAKFYVWFQLNDGPNEMEPEHRFGIRHFDGMPKPVAFAIKESTAA